MQFHVVFTFLISVKGNFVSDRMGPRLCTAFHIPLTRYTQIHRHYRVVEVATMTLMMVVGIVVLISYLLFVCLSWLMTFLHTTPFYTDTR